MARIRIIDEWLRSPVSGPSRHRAVLVVADSWSEQRVLMRAFASSADQTRPTIVLHGAELAIGPAGTDPHGQWGIHVEPPVNGRAQELRGALELAARRLAGSKGNPPRLADEASRFENKATNMWAPGAPPDPAPGEAYPPAGRGLSAGGSTRAGVGYYEPAEVAPPMGPGPLGTAPGQTRVPLGTAPGKTRSPLAATAGRPPVRPGRTQPPLATQESTAVLFAGAPSAGVAPASRNPAFRGRERGRGAGSASRGGAAAGNQGIVTGVATKRRAGATTDRYPPVARAGAPAQPARVGADQAAPGHAQAAPGSSRSARPVGARTEPGFLPARTASDGARAAGLAPTAAPAGRSTPRPAQAPPPSLAQLVGRTMPLGLELTGAERDVLNALGRGPQLTADEIGRIAGASDPVAWMDGFLDKLAGLGLDLIVPGSARGGEPTYVLRR